MMTLPSRSSDVRLDLSDVLVHERFDRLLAREDSGARLAHAGGAQRIGGPRPAELQAWFARDSSAAEPAPTWGETAVLRTGD